MEHVVAVYDIVHTRVIDGKVICYSLLAVARAAEDYTINNNVRNQVKLAIIGTDDVSVLRISPSLQVRKLEMTAFFHCSSPYFSM